MNSNLGQSTLKSTTDCIGIRAQLRNPINTQLPRRRNQVGGELERKIWVAEGFTLSFLFFSFLFFSFSVFRRFRVDYFLIFFIFVLFYGSGCYRFEQKLDAELNSFQITIWIVRSSDKFLEFDVPSFKLQLFL